MLSDEEIAKLLAEVKLVPKNWRTKLQPKAKNSAFHKERELKVQGAMGNKFILFTRQNVGLANDFTVGIRFVAESGTHYCLRRYNGNSHKHTNHLERLNGDEDHSFFGQFHIHYATERYLRKRKRIDGYAETTDRFSSIESALDLVVADGIIQIITGDDPDQTYLPW